MRKLLLGASALAALAGPAMAQVDRGAFDGHLGNYSDVDQNGALHSATVTQNGGALSAPVKTDRDTRSPALPHPRAARR